MTAIAIPVFLSQRPAGLPPLGGLALFVLIAYAALLLGVAAFLVVVLPVATLGRSAFGRAHGRPVSPYVPLGALLALAIVAMTLGGSLALNGLPGDWVGMVYLVLSVCGVSLPGVSRASSAWLLVARIAGVAVVGAVAGLVISRP